MKNIIEIATQLACSAHEGQKRKYHVSVPYVIHPCRVASRVATVPGATDVMIAAAWLHDVVEDTNVTPEEIELACGLDVRVLVGWLTNPSKGSPLSRPERKAMDREHLKLAPREAKIIKLIDRTDNLKDLQNAPYKFAHMYHGESVALLEVLKGTDCLLEQEYIRALAQLLAVQHIKHKEAPCSELCSPR